MPDFLRLLKQLFPDHSTRSMRRYALRVARINALEPAMQALTYTQLRDKTQAFKAELAKGATLDDLLEPAFAVVREAAWRQLGLRAFDVQLIGAIALHEGRIAEMRTGEGKTLVAVFVAYLEALAGRGVHVVTVNEYLALRDARQMSQVYSALGLSTGVNLAQLDADVKRTVYACDLTYGTNSEFAFDYLRDNMALDVRQRVQRPLHFALIDEADSILIDEARTPLVVSGQAETPTELYARINALVPRLTQQCGEQVAAKRGQPAVVPEILGDFIIDEENRQVVLTDSGHATVERLLREEGLLAQGQNLYDTANAQMLFHVSAALKAHGLYRRDTHYVVQGDEVVIVDDFTGRLQPGRQWSDGLHQALQAKESLPVRAENLTLASITYQKYFTRYPKLAGMTGTAATDAHEFAQVYGLGTVVVPPHRPVQRHDARDGVYATAAERDAAVLDDIDGCVQRQQPVLVGTTSIAASEALSAKLTARGIAHAVLNAKHHAREAEIVAQAGAPGAVTIATNMAGRGTDIVLGGAAEPAQGQSEAMRDAWKQRAQQVREAGGLRVLGVGRSESRRIDDQLRGRAGRQGDPGSAQFYLSLEDPLLQVFAADRLGPLLRRARSAAGQPLRSSLLDRVIAGAQRRIEGINFDRRLELLTYDLVAAKQRAVVYAQRRELLEGEDVADRASALRLGALCDVVQRYAPDDAMEEQWDLGGLEHELSQKYALAVPLVDWVRALDHVDSEAIQDRVAQAAHVRYARGLELAGTQALTRFERTVLLQILDRHWREHLTALDDLRKGIHFQQYAQQDPKIVYRTQAFTLFEDMLQHVRDDFARTVFWNIAHLEANFKQAADAKSASPQVAQALSSNG